MSSSATISATNRLHTSLQGLDRSAAKVARASGTPDLAGGLLDTTLAAAGVKANIAVLRSADDMLGTLLDVQA